MTPTELVLIHVVGKFPQIKSCLVLNPLSESFDDSCIRQLDISGRVSDGKLTLSSVEPFPNCKKSWKFAHFSVEQYNASCVRAIRQPVVLVQYRFTCFFRKMTFTQFPIFSTKNYDQLMRNSWEKSGFFPKMTLPDVSEIRFFKFVLDFYCNDI